MTRESSWKEKKNVVRGLRIAGVGLIALRISVPLIRKAARAIFKRGVHSGAGERRPQAIPTTFGLPNQDQWRVLDAPPPAFPSDYQEVASTQLACSVQEFYERFISGESPFMRNQHIEVEQQYDFIYRGWRAMPEDSSRYEYNDDKNMLAHTNESVFERVLGVKGSGGYGRTLSFRQPKKPPAQVDAECSQRQQFAIYKGDVLVLATVMNMLNIPFKDCFTVNTLWDVRPTMSGGCTVVIRLKVHFLQRTIMAGLIRVTTVRDTTNFYKRMVDAFQENLRSQAVPTRFTAGSAVQQLNRRGGSINNAYNSGGGGGQLVERLPKRQIRMLVMLFVLVGSVLHQLSVRYDH
mmetsp:Transcript_25056/g.68102  ORF Transcript_25056/g.68102 Transcript_25056/m.68102 type:complete len:349 (-) Transcript_25056:511-1557(-)|eukprot:CAMPEP_0202348128 /NCGR_PEP_ID=MMETSP1126-20121109/6194_1 /ASSEMBLY_ACC=CAM_ASM_000457 /TAXON_ID=3047 /ORGANISM="Dunaliella tertiolecta, Strain CCMP1320" /LENGTH=348 /DNA_ID=CAMNT_0048939777 /DNA_START=590 /DNA_END=1636 /DNA_ORIENTATION=-